MLIPVTGPDLNTVTVDGACRTLTELIADRLVKKYDLDVPSTHMTMGDAAGRIHPQTRQGRRARRLYRIVNDIIDRASRISRVHRCASWPKSPTCDFS